VAEFDQLDRERQRKIDETIEQLKKERRREIDERQKQLRADSTPRMPTHARCVLRRDQGHSRSRSVAEPKGTSTPSTAILRACWGRQLHQVAIEWRLGGVAILARLRTLDSAGDETERDPPTRLNWRAAGTNSEESWATH